MRTLLLAFLLYALPSQAAVFATGYVPSVSGILFGENYEDLDVAPNLPAAYDWRTVVPLSEVKSQGSCGSCWAFGTTAVLEELLRIKGVSKDVLSEQELVSCDHNFDGCSGGDFAHGYQLSPGQSLASEFPYRAANLRCKSGLSHKYKIGKWAYIGDGSHSPSVDQIKTAIITYGVVAVTVAADSRFMNYSSGVFTGRASNINHLVALVGWTADGAWILRNSWGVKWGEQGYMRIKYGANSVADQATFAELP